MDLEIDPFSSDFDSQFKLFHELMASKVTHILLVSTLYDAWIMEEDCRLSERIINEYRGLNLSRPPRLTWVATAEEALAALDQRKFDLVITMPRLTDMDAFSLGRAIKAKAPGLPVIMLSHGEVLSKADYCGKTTPDGVDRIFVWSGNTDILVALIKGAEDRMNVDRDTAAAGIRVIIFVEDSPAYLSSLLPICYRELVTQTQAVLEEGLNEEHRLLTMRARPKILVAETYEEAMDLFERYGAFVLGVISDVRFSCGGTQQGDAGVNFVSHVRSDRFDIPVLLTSSETDNAAKAEAINAVFVDKNSPTLHAEVQAFFQDHLGFGDFVFRLTDGTEVGRAKNMRTLEAGLRKLPDDAFLMHSRNNDFSRWLFARTETVLASKLRPLTQEDFDDVDSLREYLANAIQARRKRRQKGVVVNLDTQDFDPDTEFFKLGKGSLGGKARGLAFVASLLRGHGELHKKYQDLEIIVPQTLVITTEGFEDFVKKNDLLSLANTDLPDEAIAKAFLESDFPEWIVEGLRRYLAKVNYPLAIRSSSLLEDAQFRAYAGLYKTYMLSNDAPDLSVRLAHLLEAIKLVYASSYFQAPKAFSKRVGHRTEEEKMAVIIQQLVGARSDGYFYPAISGVGQSHNYYPYGHQRQEDGIVTIALGLGRAVVEGERTLRFSPKFPQLLPQRSTVDDILDNSQRYFYSLKMDGSSAPLSTIEDAHLAKREVTDAEGEPTVKMLASTYLPDEHRIRDTTLIPGHRVVTFASVLKYNQLPLAEILADALKLGETGMGCPVELEFSVNWDNGSNEKPQFAFLQLRPMTARAESSRVRIHAEECDRAFCYTDKALGNAIKEDMADILFVRPDTFDPAQTTKIAREIGKFNARLVKDGRKYLLIGPGRWGSADRWLGIPVTWADISGVGAIVESASDKLSADPSQGSHFFHNITTMGINYITLSGGANGTLDWDWLQAQPIVDQSEFVTHIRLPVNLVLKVDGRSSRCVIYTPEENEN
ncbi:MAG: PEP/pyruvate-binding domain-containing protein [Desulfosarcinaceae bacterium]